MLRSQKKQDLLWQIFDNNPVNTGDLENENIMTLNSSIQQD